MKFAYTSMLPLMVSFIVVHCDSIDLKEAKTLAISSDFAFITAFVTDYNSNYDLYVSYMEVNNIQLPNSIMNFYNQLNTFTQVSLVPSILPDIFPFTAFYTFISVFPWYSSLLEDGGITKFYLPSDITATDGSSSIDGASSAATTSQSIQLASKTSISTLSSSVIASTSLHTPVSSMSKAKSSSADSSSSALSSTSNGIAADTYVPLSSLLLLSFIAILL